MFTYTATQVSRKAKIEAPERSLLPLKLKSKVFSSENLIAFQAEFYTKY